MINNSFNFITSYYINNYKYIIIIQLHFYIMLLRDAVIFIESKCSDCLCLSNRTSWRGLINFFVTRETSFLVESDVRNYADIRVSSYYI